MGILALKALLEERHLHAYSDFVAEYNRRAKELGLSRQATPPTKAQYYRWVGGQIQHLPRGYHCAVLERMFPGWTARELFGHQRPSRTSGDLLTAVSPAVQAAELAGLWVTCFVVDGGHVNVDLSTITVTKTGVTAQNYPPSPRLEGQVCGYANDIEAGLFGRHAIGQWRNVSDRYFYGTVQLAVWPGEMTMDGYYTAVVTDTEVGADRWRWARVEPRSSAGVDLTTVTLAEPRAIYEMLAGRTRFDGAIPLAEVTENR
ncbi:MAG TPA: hypothetical protein VE197_20845 [Mycobacterium sp.]|nr:hypothetical protein [Mycobacterium sp.]